MALLSVGTTAIAPVSVPVGSVAVRFLIDRSLITSLTVKADLSVDLSTDGGATWTPLAGATFDMGKGGLLSASALDPVLGTAVSGFQCPLPAPSGTNWQVRGFITMNELTTTGGSFSFV